MPIKASFDQLEKTMHDALPSNIVISLFSHVIPFHTSLFSFIFSIFIWNLYVLSFQNFPSFYLFYLWLIAAVDLIRFIRDIKHSGKTAIHQLMGLHFCVVLSPSFTSFAMWYILYRVLPPLALKYSRSRKAADVLQWFY